MSLCHCLDCQRRTGSPYGTAAFFRSSDIEISGEHSEFTRSSDSGNPVEFHFCPICGSSVYWNPARFPDFTAIAVGAFADPGFPGPTKSVYPEHRHHWLPPGL